MCGFIFLDQKYGSRIPKYTFDSFLRSQKWRGPDAFGSVSVDDGHFLMGHNRLSIIDPENRSNQPMASRDGRFLIVYNGEIYNHKQIRIDLCLDCLTESDTETLIEGYSKIGESIFELLDGMFAFVILDRVNNSWVAARDFFGIKPLYVGYDKNNYTVIGSEAAVLARLMRSNPCQLAIDEWRIIRRPLPGASFFKNIFEVLPGRLIRSDKSEAEFWKLAPSSKSYDQDHFESLLYDAVKTHELSDCTNTSLLSGGLDSAVIAAISSVSKCYCIGLPSNNEFEGASETALRLDKELECVEISFDSLQEIWRDLTRLRGEPLGVPNEGLIYQVCKSMPANEKVVLTGEGADELLFGYDGIFNWGLEKNWNGPEDFLLRYGYNNNVVASERLLNYIENLRLGKSTVNFLEDFFYSVHLPGLLRRMDFASMAASKEARVPFVSKKLVSYMYRRPSKIKINNKFSKLPLRTMASKFGLHGALQRKKIGFSAQLLTCNSRFKEYQFFQSIVMDELKW